MRTSIRIAIPALRSSTGRCWAGCPGVILAGVVLLGLSVSFLSVSYATAQLPQLGAPASDDSNIPKPIRDTLDRVDMRNRPNDPQAGQKASEKDDACLLPPLTLIIGPTIAAEQLQIPVKARKEYHEACAALKDKKTAEAEKHLRKAVQDYAKYSAAWVTLGQVLATQQRMEEAGNACFQSSTVDPGYVPAYLCLADIGARAHAWVDVLKLSGRALELDPGNNVLAYEYHAAANLNLHNLAAAEKSGLRAAEIDKDHREPRVHFILAQVYEAKGDLENEAAQLQEYLKRAADPDDIAVVKQYLARLETHSGKRGAVDSPSGGILTGSVASSTRRWGPPDIDEAVPPVQTGISCPLPQILEEAGKRTQDLIESLQRFSATESVEQIDIGKNGKRRISATELVNYVAQIEQNSSGYPGIEEFRSGSSGIRRASVMDSGMAAFALIFHPAHIANFSFRCEGFTNLQGSPAWQVRFEEGADSSKSFTAIRMGGSIYLPRFKGRAWITTDTYDCLRIETDLVSPIPKIDLQLEHLIIIYAPVEFQKRHLRLWLPQSTSVYIAYHGHRYERAHNFSDFQLFAVDTVEAIKDPPPAQFAPVTLSPRSLEMIVRFPPL